MKLVNVLIFRTICFLPYPQTKAKKNMAATKPNVIQSQVKESPAADDKLSTNMSAMPSRQPAVFLVKTQM